MTGARRSTLLIAGLMGAVTTIAFAPEALALPTMVVQSTTSPVAAAQASETPVTASCPSATTLIGGGIETFYSGPPLDPSLNPYEPINGLIMRGSTPSDGAAAPSADGATDPSAWTAYGGFAGQFEAVDSATAFAMCSTADGPLHTTVVSRTINAPTEASTTAPVTATCPDGTRLVGGGARMTPASSASQKPVGSYPSTASGTIDATTDPDSWTAVGETGGRPEPSNMTTAYAVCSADPTLHTTVVRADVIDHPAGPGNSTTPGADPIATATATCPASSQLLSGGGLAVGSAPGNDGGNVQQGVHIRGTYPSTVAGTAVTDGTTAPKSWTTVIQSGGTPMPGTDTFSFALCARAADAAFADLAVTNAATPVTASIGDTVTYTLHVVNNGPQSATGVNLSMPLPSGVTFSSATSTSTSGSCGSPASLLVTCNFGMLVPGAAVTATVAGTITAAGTLSATMTVAGNELDPVSANNSATATTTVAGPPTAPPVAAPLAVLSPLPTAAATAAPAGVSAAQVKKGLRSQIVPRASSARVSLLRTRGIALAFRALRAGEVTVSWYRRPAKPGAALVLLARGTRTFKAAGTATITVRPTILGRQQLRNLRNRPTTAKGTFQSPGSKAIVAARALRFRR